MLGPDFVSHFIASVLYALLGVAVFAGSFLCINKVVPFSLRKEIEEDQNIALAIIIGSVLLGLSIIISAAVG